MAVNYGTKRIVVGAHYGLRDWLAQRVTAALMALFTLLVVRSISEVPLQLQGYSPEFVAHLLLLMTLAAETNESRIRKTLAARPCGQATAFSKPSMVKNSMRNAKPGT